MPHPLRQDGAFDFLSRDGTEEVCKLLIGAPAAHFGTIVTAKSPNFLPNPHPSCNKI